ncbi:MAG: hypothetical protein LQ350_007738 [Teloschistes chrysophthalmus]|nr:MAG: hypothetical protein LQ350_007738 [Niorma chrysophthalma]
MPLPTPIEGAHHPVGSRDWEHHRETIERLYVTDDRSLPEVVGMMTSLHGFVATERQYKRRISDWHFDKNVKDEEMRAIIATEALRLQQGKRSVFYVRDRQVDSKKIDRFAQRKKINKNKSAALAKSSLPPDVRCITPPEDGHSSLQSKPSQPKSRASKRKATSHDLRDTTSTEYLPESQRRVEDLPARIQEESTQATAPNPTLLKNYPRALNETSAPECLRVLSARMSELYQDELYNPSPVAPERPQHTVSSRMAVLQERLQAAQQSHANLTPKSSEEEPFSTAALMRQGEKTESDLRALEQHMPRPPSSSPPRTVSPKEVALDYNEIEEDAKMPLFSQNNALGIFLDLKSNKVDRGVEWYSRRTTNPHCREMILTESWVDDAVSPSNLRQESERINKDVEEVDILKHNMQTSRSDTTSQDRPASSTRRDQRGPPPKQAKLASEQSKLSILSTIASVKESAETSSQLSSGPLSKGRSKSPFTEGSPYATDASTPIPVAQGVSPKLMTQPSTSSASSHAKADEITQTMDNLEERLHSKKGSLQPHHQLSKSSSGTSRNTSNTPAEPSVDASGDQKDFLLRDQSHRIDLPDSSGTNHDPSSLDQAPDPSSETSILIDTGLADRDLLTRKSSYQPFFTTGRTPLPSESIQAIHDRPKALDKDNYYSWPIAIAVSSLPASLRQRPIDMFYFRFFTDNTARLLVSHDCGDNGFRSILPRMALRNEHLLGLLLAYSASHRARLLGYPRPVARIAQWTREIFPSLRHVLVSNTSSPSNDALAISIMLTSMTITCPDVFEVPIPWQHHLFNAKRLLKDRSITLEGGPPQSSDDQEEWDFLDRWLTYIAVTGSLNPPKEDGNFQEFGVRVRHHLSVPMIRSNEVDCLYGCTTELMEMLGAAAEYTNRHADVGTMAASCTSIGEKRIFPYHPPILSADQQTTSTKWLAIANYRFPYRHASYEGRNASNGALEGMEVNAVQKLVSQANMVFIYRRIEGRPRHDPSVQMHVQEIVDTVQLVSVAN